MPPRKKENLAEVFIGFGVDVLNRSVFLHGEIEAEEVSMVIAGIKYMEESDTDKLITVYISSLGGDVYEMFGLHDIFKTLRSPVCTVTYGKCQSAAVLVAAAGDPGLRLTMPNTKYMLHASRGFYGDEIREDETFGEVVHHKDLNEAWFSLLAQVTKDSGSISTPVHYWRKLCKKPENTYFSAERAIELGLADAIYKYNAEK